MGKSGAAGVGFEDDVDRLIAAHILPGRADDVGQQPRSFVQFDQRHHIGKILFERRMIAVLLLEAFEPLLRPADMKLLERLVRESKTWAFVDELAIAIVGPLVERSPALLRVLDRWATDDDFWLRRCAMLALLRPLRRGEGDFARFTRYAEAMLNDREFFIRKAIGWVLRETAKKRPDLVYQWLLPRCAIASGVTVREAVKYLSTQQRADVLKAYGSAQRH